MVVKVLWAVGSSILVVLGGIHMYYTFFTDKFSPEDSNLIPGMQTTSPKLTKATSMWKAWKGFNASHSSGAIFIGVINIFLLFSVFEVLLDHPLFFIINVLTLLFYLWLAKRYWFKIPFLGILLALICFVIAFLLDCIKY